MNKKYFISFVEVYRGVSDFRNRIINVHPFIWLQQQQLGHIRNHEKVMASHYDTDWFPDDYVSYVTPPTRGIIITLINWKEMTDDEVNMFSVNKEDIGQYPSEYEN